MLYDAYTQGRAAFWRKRAADFEKAKPKVDEWHGSKTREQLREQWLWCDEVARACRARAALIRLDDEFAELVRDVSWRGAA